MKNNNNLSKQLTFILLGGGLLLLDLTVSTASAAPATLLVSRSTAGTISNGYSASASISANGSVVAFYSNGVNLVKNDKNNYADVFVRNFSTGATQCISINKAGALGNNHSWLPSISGNGGLVAYQSNASNLVAGDKNNAYDIFLRNLGTGTTQRISTSDNGLEGNGHSYDPSFSADGGYVAFQSLAKNLVPGDTNAHADIFVRNLKLQKVSRVSVGANQIQANNLSESPSLSANGNLVAFVSAANNLVPGDKNGKKDVFVRNIATGSTRRISVTSAKVEGNNDSSQPSISANGQYVAFVSKASNLVKGDFNLSTDIFVHDLTTGTTNRVSVGAANLEANAGSLEPSISSDGRYVSFWSWADQLAADDFNNAADIFVRDLKTAKTQRISVDSSNVEGFGESYAPSISANGRFVAFDSRAKNLVPGDNNSTADVFLRRRW